MYVFIDLYILLVYIGIYAYINNLHKIILLWKVTIAVNLDCMC